MYAPTRSYISTPTGTAEWEFILPRWLAEEHLYENKEIWLDCHRLYLSQGIRIHLRGEGPQISAEDAHSGDAVAIEILESIILERKSESVKRVDNMIAIANFLLTELVSTPNVRISSGSWLPNLLDDPNRAEIDAIEIWNDFVNACEIPESFNTAKRAGLTLADLMVLRRGVESGKHRQTFANHFPWVTRQILAQSDAPDEEFQTIDDNPANSIPLAAKYVCCCPDTACEKAVAFSKSLARHRQNAALDNLLGIGGLPPIADSSRIRSILLEAHSEDSELITHIGKNTSLAKDQIERAIETLFVYKENVPGGEFKCAYSLAALLVRMMVRNAYEPSRLNPEVLVVGLAAVAADSLSAYVAKQREYSLSASDTDSTVLDLGVLAFLHHIGEEKHLRLTMKQLTKFAAAAGVHCQHELTLVEQLPDSSWPAPTGWNSEIVESYLDLVMERKVKCLTSVERLIKEGKEMHNCLAEGRYIRSALLGNLAFFSISSAEGRATLAVKPDWVTSKYDTPRIIRWEIHELRGPENKQPNSECKWSAFLILELLNMHCLYDIDIEELSRRQRIIELLEGNNYNTDIVEARARWFEIYTRYLPRSFSKVEPEAIVANYMNKGT